MRLAQGHMEVRVRLQVGRTPRQVLFALHPIASDVPGLSLNWRIGSRNSGSYPQRAHSLTPILSNFSFQHPPSLLCSDHPGFLLCHKSTESTLNILSLYPGRLSSLHCSLEQLLLFLFLPKRSPPQGNPPRYTYSIYPLLCFETLC